MHGKSLTQHTRQTAEEGVTSCSGKRQTEREDERQTETGEKNEEQVRQDAGGSKTAIRTFSRDCGTRKHAGADILKHNGNSHFGRGGRSLIFTALLL